MIDSITLNKIKLVAGEWYECVECASNEAGTLERFWLYERLGIITILIQLKKKSDRIHKSNTIFQICNK